MPNYSFLFPHMGGSNSIVAILELGDWGIGKFVQNWNVIIISDNLKVDRLTIELLKEISQSPNLSIPKLATTKHSVIIDYL